MANKRHDMLGVASADTIIGSGVKIKGNLTSEGDLVIDGMLQGSIKAQGNVTVGVNAVIAGDVSGQNITVAGRLTGNITAGEHTTIAETGEVTGDIATTVLNIGTGAGFNGTIKMPRSSSIPETLPAVTEPPAAKRKL